MATVKSAVAEGRVILVIGCNAWGRGNTESTALRNWRRNVPGVYFKDGEVEVAVVSASAKAYVSDFDGSVITPAGEDKPVLIRRRKVKRPSL